MKKILIVSYTEKKLFAAQSAFSGENLEFILSSELQKNEVPNYAVVETFEKMTELRNEFSPKNWDVKFIFIGRNNKIQEYFDLGGRILIDPFLLTSKIASMLLKRSVESEPSIHLQEIFGENFKKYYSYKITNIYRIGYFADLICKDAIDQKLNFIAIRSFFDHALMFNSYLVDLGLAKFPCELEFSFKENSFVLLLHISTSGLKHNQILESLGEENLKNPLASLLKSCFKNTDYLDVLNNTKNKRLSIFGLWLSEDERIQLSTSSISINTLGNEVNKNVLSEKNEDNESSYDYNHQLNPKDLEDLDRKELPKLPGAHKVIEELDDDSILKKEEGVIEEMASFIQNQVELKNLELDDDGQAIYANQLSVEDVKKILKDHLDQELVQKFSSEEEKVLAAVVSSAKNPEDLINTLRGKKLKEEEDIKAHLNSALEVINNQIIKSGKLFKDAVTQNDVQFINNTLKEKSANEVLVNSFMVLKDTEFKIDGHVISFNDKEKNELSEQLQNTFDELLLSSDFQVLNPVEQQKIVEEKIKKLIQNKVAKESHESELVKSSMGNIQKEIVDKFKSIGNQLDPDEQVEIITSSFIRNAKEMKTVINGGQTVEDVVGEIIEQMFISEDQKNAFKKTVLKIVEKAKDQQIISRNLNVEEVDKVEFYEEQDSDEPAIDSESEIKIQMVEKVVKGPKEAINKNTEGISATEKPEIIEETGYEEDDDSEYQISPGQTSKKNKNKNADRRVSTDYEDVPVEDPYKVLEGADKEIEQDEGYPVKNSKSFKSKNKKISQDAPDNSYLLKRIEELEKKLKTERAQIREIEKAKNAAKQKVKAIKDNVSEITKNIKVPDLTFEATDPEKIESMASDIRSASGLLEIQKAKILEVLEKEKQINVKYAEIQDAYRKTKAALDTAENKYAAEIDELERSNRHKEHLVEQMKTKVANVEKDHQIELKRITFDLKKQAQRASTVEVDRYKQKAASLEREKNAIKRMLDDLKSSVSKEKVKVVEKEIKASPKIAEFEAQKKRAEVKLQATEAELSELKKTMAAKDKIAREVGEQRIKYEADMNKWKKDALSKQSEVEKAVNEKKRAEEEVLIFKRKYEGLVKTASAEKKNEANAAQAQQDAKASLTSAKVAEDKLLQLKEEMAKEKSQLKKDLAKEKEQLEEIKKTYLAESNKVKALETKMKEMTQTIEEQAASLRNHEAAFAEANAKASGGAKSNITAKDLSVLASKNRLLEETSKKVNKDLNDTKAKLEEAKKEIANLTKKTNETQFKLQEKEKLAEKLQNELKAFKDKEAEAKKKEADVKKAA